MVFKSFNNALVGLSIAVTGVSFANPEILRFGMDPSVFASAGAAEMAVRFAMFQFLHGSLFHLLGNGFFLIYFGTAIEMKMGSAKYAAFFAFSTLLVGAGILTFSNGLTVGISGFAMAVLTYAALLMKEQRNPEYRAAFFFVFLNVAFGLVGNISLAGHAFGAIAGWVFRAIEKN